MRARIVIGANYGDEGKGTVVAKYAKESGNVLNVLTNGGAQRGHSILTKDGSITFQHFGAGTYHGADNYYSRFFILNPMQFAKEYETLIVKPNNIYRDFSCRWSTPYDSMSNLIEEQQRKRHASCCMGIWNTIKRYNSIETIPFDAFVKMENPMEYLERVKNYYERIMAIPREWLSIWNSPHIMINFIDDCKFMAEHTKVCDLSELSYYNDIIFENGQGLLLCDTGKDTYDTTPSNTGISYALELLKSLDAESVTAHYVTRPYLTRHGDGGLDNEESRRNVSGSIEDDRTNHYNEFQGNFRYGNLDIDSLKKRIAEDSRGIDFELEVTHCDEMDRLKEFGEHFNKINVYDKAMV